MPNDFDNEMRFVLFDQKDTAGNKPQYKGECTINGETYKLAGWRKTSKGGKPYISGTIETEDAAEKYREAAQPVREGQETEMPSDEMPDDGIPF
jgi:hypothetical protein